MIKVFIGYDERQPLAFTACAHSIWKHASKPVEIVRLDLKTLPITRRGLTAFTYSRFLVPYLSGYHGTSVFMDADMLALGDIAPLFDYTLERDHPVFVVKNRLRFEWPSLMVFKNWNCKALTPEFVENPANKLFDFAWASSVGDLPSHWNHLVGYDLPQDAQIAHYTKGIPCWDETKNCEYSQEWKVTATEAISSCSFDAIMGPSVHNQRAA